MIYAIKVNDKYFDLDTFDGGNQLYSYCEQQFELDGDQWDEIKENRFLEELCDFLQLKGIKVEIFTE